MTITTGMGAMDVAAKLFLRARAGNAFMDAYSQIDPRWSELIEVKHDVEAKMPFVCDLSSVSAGRFKGQHSYGEGFYAKYEVEVFPFSAGKKIKREDADFSLLPTLATMNEAVGYALADLIRRFAFNCFACGDQILCPDVQANQYVYDTTHADGSQTNKLSAAFSEGALESAITAMGVLKDSTGKRPIGSKANYILLNPSREVAANKLLMPGTIVVERQVTAAATAGTRMNQSIFGSLQPIYDPEIDTDQFILINTRGRVRPFIMNLPVISVKNGKVTFDASCITTFKDEDHELWKCKGYFYAGWAATEGWMYTLGSAAEGGWGTKIDPDTAAGDI